MTNIPDELIDIVDEHDQVVKVIWRSQSKGIQYARIVLAFIINHEGKIAILRRSADKEHAALCLALIGGGVQSGETYLQAVKREVMEEAMINIDEHTYTQLAYYKPTQTPMPYFTAVYEVRIPHSNIVFQPEDFSELYWLHPHEFFERLTAGEKVSKGLEFLIREHYLSK